MTDEFERDGQQVSQPGAQPDQQHSPDVLSNETTGTPAHRQPGQAVSRRAFGATLAAGLLLASAGGYAVAHATTSDPAPTSPGSGPLGAPAAMPGRQGMPTTVKDSMMPYGGQRVVFEQRGLSNSSTTMHVYGLDAASVLTSQDVSRVAKAFGFAASQEPTKKDGYWIVGSENGTKPTLTVSGDGWASVSYYDPTASPDCVDVQKGVPAPVPEGGVSGGVSGGGSGGGSGGVSGDAQPGPAGSVNTGSSIACPRPTPNGSLSDATAAMRSLVATLQPNLPSGSDLVVVPMSVTTGTGSGGPATVANSSYLGDVSVQLQINGVATSIAWSATFAGDAVSSFYGPLAPIVDLGEYPVISPADAAKRLSDPRFSQTWGGVMPMAAEGISTNSTGSAGSTGQSGDTTVSHSVTPPSPAALPNPGDPVSWPVETEVLTTSDLGWTPTIQSDGSVLLVPTYTLSTQSGQGWSTVGLAESALNFG